MSCVWFCTSENLHSSKKNFQESVLSQIGLLVGLPGSKFRIIKHFLWSSLLCWFVYFVLFGDRVSLCNAGWPRTHFVTQVDFICSVTLLFQSPECWDQRHKLPYLVCSSISAHCFFGAPFIPYSTPSQTIPVRQSRPIP